MCNKNWVVYITFYRGRLLPPFYIGVSYDIERRKYRGTPKSKEYSEIWKSELKTNPHLFVTRCIKNFGHDKQSAYEYENKIQTIFSVDVNPLYINKHINNSCFGANTKSGKRHYYYDHEEYHFIHETGIEEITTQNILCSKYNLTQSSVSQLVNGKLKSTSGWFLYNKCVAKKEMVDIMRRHLNWRVGVNSPNFNDEKKPFINKSGCVVLETSYIMKSKYGCSEIGRVCKGERLQSNGWFLFDDSISHKENLENIIKYYERIKIKNVDGAKCVWYNKKLSCKEFLTAYDFCKKYNLDRSHVTKLKKGKLKQVKGWKIKNDRN